MILLLLACAEQQAPCDGRAVEATAELTDVPTVIRLTWETDEVTTGAVTFDTPFGPVTTPAVTGTSHAVLLRGNRAATDVSWRVETEEPGWCEAGGTTPTGDLPAGLPPVTLTGDADAGPRYTIVPIVKADTSWLAVVDAEGEYVWAWSDPLEGKATAFFGAELTLDRGALLADTSAAAQDAPGDIQRIGWDGVPLDPARADGLHTDFVQLPDGTIASLGWDVREVEGRKFLGDTIVEIAPDGTSRTVWSVWDDFTPDTSRMWETGWYPGGADVEDWSHLNGINWDPANGTYLVSATFDQSVLAVDRAAGTLAWRLASDGGDYANPFDASLVAYPHSVQAVDGGVLVFNRGNFRDSDTCSEAVQIELWSGEARRAWSYASEACLLVPFLGSARRRDDGRTLVDWTTSGQLDAVEPDGTTTWRLNLDLGAAFAFADYVDSLY